MSGIFRRFSYSSFHVELMCKSCLASFYVKIKRIDKMGSKLPLKIHQISDVCEFIFDSKVLILRLNFTIYFLIENWFLNVVLDTILLRKINELPVILV